MCIYIYNKYKYYNKIQIRKMTIWHYKNINKIKHDSLYLLKPQSNLFLVLLIIYNKALVLHHGIEAGKKGRKCWKVEYINIINHQENYFKYDGMLRITLIL